MAHTSLLNSYSENGKAHFNFILESSRAISFKERREKKLYEKITELSAAEATAAETMAAKKMAAKTMAAKKMAAETMAAKTTQL